MKQAKPDNKLSSKDKEMMNFLWQACDMQQEKISGGKNASPKFSRSTTNQQSSPTKSTNSSPSRFGGTEETLRDKISNEDMEMVKMYLLRKCDTQRNTSSPRRTSKRKTNARSGVAGVKSANNIGNDSDLSSPHAGERTTSRNDDRDDKDTVVSESSRTFNTASQTSSNGKEQFFAKSKNNPRSVPNISGVLVKDDSIPISSSASIESTGNGSKMNTNDKMINRPCDKNELTLALNDEEPKEIGNRPSLSLTNDDEDYLDDLESISCLSPISLLSFGVLKQVLESSKPSAIMGNFECSRESDLENIDTSEPHMHTMHEAGPNNSDGPDFDKNTICEKPVNILPEEEQAQKQKSKVRFALGSNATKHGSAHNVTATNGHSDVVTKLKDRMENARVAGDIDSLFNASQECLHLFAMRNHNDHNRSKHLALMSEEVSYQDLFDSLLNGIRCQTSYSPAIYYCTK